MGIHAKETIRKEKSGTSNWHSAPYVLRIARTRSLRITYSRILFAWQRRFAQHGAKHSGSKPRQAMANTYYAPGKQRAERVKALFARVASRYDLMNDLQSFGLHRYWKARLVELGAPGRGGQALDVCCGTADLGLAFARHGARVIGLDFSDEMLALARTRKIKGPQLKAESMPGKQPKEDQHQGAGSQSGGTLAFVRGDAMRLPFPDNTFDIVSVGYGLRNLVDWTEGLEEMRRVAKVGGRLVVLDLGNPDNPVWRRVYYGYLRLFVPCLGLLFCGSASAYGYLLESLKHYPAQDGVAAKMHELGLREVKIIKLLGAAMAINYAEK